MLLFFFNLHAFQLATWPLLSCLAVLDSSPKAIFFQPLSLRIRPSVRNPRAIAFASSDKNIYFRESLHGRHGGEGPIWNLDEARARHGVLLLRLRYCSLLPPGDYRQGLKYYHWLRHLQAMLLAIQFDFLSARKYQRESRSLKHAFILCSRCSMLRCF